MNRTLRWFSAFFIVLVVLTAVASGQDARPPLRFGFYGGLGFPTGDFGSTSSLQAGGASTGFLVGGEFGIPLSDAVTIWTSATFAFNSLSEDFVKSYSGSSSAVSGTLGTWTTIWPMTGIRYTGPISERVSYYFQGQIGLLLGSSPDVNATQSGYSYAAPSVSASSFAYGFGAGLMFGRIINVRMVYSSGQPTYEYTVTAKTSGPGFSSTSTFKTKSDFPATLLQIIVGVLI